MILDIFHCLLCYKSYIPKYTVSPYDHTGKDNILSSNWKQKQIFTAGGFQKAELGEVRTKYKWKADCGGARDRGKKKLSLSLSVSLNHYYDQAIGKTVSVTYQPRKDKTGIKKIVLADCERKKL